MRGRAAGGSGVHHEPEQRAAQQRDRAHAAQHAAARRAHRLRPGAPLRHRHELSQTRLMKHQQHGAVVVLVRCFHAYQNRCMGDEGNR